MPCSAKDAQLLTILTAITQGDALGPSQETWLIDVTREDHLRTAALGMTEATLRGQLHQQVEFLATHYQSFEQFCHDQLGLRQHLLWNLWQVWLPLALGLRQKQQQKGAPFIQGIVGLQGTGKTTLTAILTWLMAQWGYNCVSLSLDDLYLSHAQRLRLREENPRLRWRGPPGTHDVTLGRSFIQRFQALGTDPQPLWVPRFDKSLQGGSGDRTAPEAVMPPVDILLFEGWFVGILPRQDWPAPEALPSLLQDPEAYKFGMQCNQQLSAYLPLWEQLDQLLILYLADFTVSRVWRQEAEEKLRDHYHGGMDVAEIDRFVTYFWQALHPDLFLKPLISEPGSAQMVIEIQNDRRFGRIFPPGSSWS